ncbi:unnamed protein product [Agarophyton chilense]
MFKSLLKAAQSLERGMDSAFSNAPASHTAFKNATLDFAPFSVRLGSVFAEGGYSFIHVATPLSSNAPSNARFAVKRMSCTEQESKRQAHIEIDFLRKLPAHRNLVKFYDAIFHQGHAFLLFELLDGGTLPEILSRSNLTSQKKLTILVDVTSAVVHLHSQQPPIFIRDVKLENVLYDRLQRCYKLCDFGSATQHTCCPVSRADILALEEEIANNCTSMYRAPELVDLYSKPFICERADVWSLGCIWYALLFGSLPFDGSSSLQITTGLASIPTQPTYPHQFISLLEKMLVVDPAHRYDSFQVLEHLHRILGRQTDPQVISVGNELRRRRFDDFGIDATSRAAVESGSAVSHSKELEESDSCGPVQPVSQSLIGDLDELLSVSERPTSDTKSVNDKGINSGWADFGAAFTKPATDRVSKMASTASSNFFLPELAMSTSSQKPKGTCTRATAGPPQSVDIRPGGAYERNLSRRSPGYEPSSTSTVPVLTRNQGEGAPLVPSLIDLSDFTPSPNVSSIPLREQVPGRGATTHQQQPQGQESGKAANFEDLIDFG